MKNANTNNVAKTNELENGIYVDFSQEPVNKSNPLDTYFAIAFKNNGELDSVFSGRDEESLHIYLLTFIREFPTLRIWECDRETYEYPHACYNDFRTNLKSTPCEIAFLECGAKTNGEKCTNPIIATDGFYCEECRESRCSWVGCNETKGENSEFCDTHEARFLKSCDEQMNEEYPFDFEADIKAKIIAEADFDYYTETRNNLHEMVHELCVQNGYEYFTAKKVLLEKLENDLDAEMLSKCAKCTAELPINCLYSVSITPQFGEPKKVCEGCACDIREFMENK